MSIKIQERVWERSRLKGTDLVAVLALADWAGPDGVSYYAREALMRRTRLKDPAGYRKLRRRLLASGEVYIVERFRPDGRQTTNYFCVLVALEEEDLIEAAGHMGIPLLDLRLAAGLEDRASKGEETTGDAAASSTEPGLEDQGGGMAQASKGGPGGPSGVVADPGKSKGEGGLEDPLGGGLEDPLYIKGNRSVKKKEPKKDKGLAALPYYEALAAKVPAQWAKDPRFVEAWLDWDASRRESGKKLTPTAVRLQGNKMIKMGRERAIAALVHSATNGYQGLYEPRRATTAPNGAQPGGRPSQPAPQTLTTKERKL